MSKNYELLQRSGRSHRMFAAILQEPGRAAADLLRKPRGARASTVQREQGRPSWNPSGDEADHFSSEPCDQPGKESRGRLKGTSGFWHEPPSDVVRRGKAALRSVIDIVQFQRLAKLYSNGRSAAKLASIAHEEQVKLMQRVFLTGKEPPRVAVFCGIESGNGCSRVCAESAATLAAQIAGTVCLVDADLRSPTLHRYFGLENGRGFAEAMLQLRPVREYSHQFGNLWIMTSGAHSAAPHNILASKILRQRVQELREAFDFVLIDAPPLNPFADATRLAPLADGVVLVVGANTTRREAARKAQEELKAADSKILAAVLNRRTFPIPESIYRRL